MKTTQAIYSSINPAELPGEARKAISEGRYYDAMDLVNTCLLADHQHMEARLLKGLCYLYLNQSRKAAFLFDQVLEEEEGHAEALACYAEYHKLMMNFEEAAHYISAAIAADPDHATYHRQAAEISFLANDKESAFGLINRAIVLSPFREELYYWRALIMNSMKRTQVAIHDLNRALALNPRYVDALKLRAKLRMYFGTFDDAVKDLKLAQYFENTSGSSLRRVA